MIDTTTNHFKSSAYFHEIFKKEGAHYLERPIVATKMKLINNLLLGSFMAAIVECVILAWVYPEKRFLRFSRRVQAIQWY